MCEGARLDDLGEAGMKNKALMWILILLLLIIALLLGIVLGWWGSGSSDEPSPTATATPSATAPTGGPPNIVAEFVPRPITTGEYNPTPDTLTGEVLETVDEGWVVAIHNNDAYTDGGIFTPGSAILYLIAPDGTQYELVNLDSLGFDSVDIVAWGYGNYEILLVEDRSELHVFDMVTGTVTSQWAFCGEGGSVRGFSVGSNWVLRGTCSGAPIDGLYDSSGTELPSNIIGDNFGDAVFDIGPVQVLSAFEVPSIERFHAHYPDGTDAYLSPPPGGDCYPIDQGDGATVAAVCFGPGGLPSVWLVPINGSAATELVPQSEISDFRSELGYSVGDYLGITGFCANGGKAAVETSGFEERLGVLHHGDLIPSFTAPFVHSKCHAADGNVMLVSGNGPLWWIDWDNGTNNVELLPGSGSNFPLYVVGAAETTAIAHPGF